MLAQEIDGEEHPILYLSRKLTPRLQRRSSRRQKTSWEDMAAARVSSLQNLSEAALCSICLEYFKDPVIIIECGHNFCRACLTQCWEGTEGRKVSCPQCREKVQRNFIPNRLLANLAEKLSHLETQTEGVCEEHQEPLKLFCKDDKTLMCLVCDRSKEHRDHEVVPVKEAAQEYQDLITSRLEHLEDERGEVTKCKEETEEESQALLQQTKAEREEMNAVLRNLQQFLGKHEKLLGAQLEEVEKEIARKRGKHLAKLSEKLSSLEDLIQEMEEKGQQPPNELLQDVRSLSENCEQEETFRDLVAFPLELKSKIWGVFDRNGFLADLEKHFRDISLSGPQLHKAANVTLDPETAFFCLNVSGDCKHVNYRKYRYLTDNPERFDDCYYVLGREGFTAGRHYWEVTMEGEGTWAVGVARKSVRRKGDVECRTEEGIWAFEKRGNGYRASNLPKKSFLPLSGKLRRIRVSLNYDEGRVSFHDLDKGSHLYTFSGASFSGETLLPFFEVDDSLTISS
ncbi:E3 ubiquitin-protein ligase TRIM39 isoform X3 [Pogona vitticeps]